MKKYADITLIKLPVRKPNIEQMFCFFVSETGCLI